MDHFVVKKVTNLEDVQEGHKFDTSDFATVTNSGKFVQMQFIEEEEVKLEPYQVKPGVWTIEKTMAGVKLQTTELINDRILDSFINTKEITDKADCFFNRLHVYKELGFEVAKRSILLYGPAGSGKSTCINKVVEKYIKDGRTAAIIWGTDKIEAHMVKDFFKSFEYVGVDKVILVAEDIGGVEVEQTRLRSDPSLLALLDNQEKAFKIPILIIATTNHPEIFLGNLTNRPNRIDDKIEVGYPSPEARLELFAFFSKKSANDLDHDVSKALLSKDSSSFSPAHLREVLIRSMIYDKSLISVIKEMQEEIKQYNKGYSKTSKIGFD